MDSVLQRGNIVRRWKVSDLFQQRERILLRLDTPEETLQALSVLKHISSQADWNWIASVEMDRANQIVIRVAAPGNPPL
jgi:hypothetical protein